MADSNGPTYASLTAAEPTYINGLLDMHNSSSPMVDQNLITTMGVMNPLPMDSSPLSLDNDSPMELPHESMPDSDVKSESPDMLLGEPDKQTLMAVLNFLRKNNLKGSEDVLRQECSFYEEVEDVSLRLGLGENQKSLSLTSYKTEGEPEEYDEAYSRFQNYVERSLDAYKHEIAQILFPLFVHMYLELIYNNHVEAAHAFLEKFGPGQEPYYQEDVHKLSLVTTRAHMNGYQLMDNFRSNQFTVHLCRDTYSHLKRFIAERGDGVVPRIIQDRLFFDVSSGAPRSKSQVNAIAGALEGEAPRQMNKTKILYGLPREPEITTMAREEEETGEEEAAAEKPRKKKVAKRDPTQKGKKNDPNAPSITRIPFPELRDAEKIEKAKAYRDAQKRVTLGRDTLPSICFYTFLNAVGSVTATDISDDSSLLVYATADSSIKVQSITPSKLKTLKSAEQLEDIDKDADDVMARIMDDRTADQSRSLLGHSGPIYSCSFSPDKTLLLSAGEDGTIRLWSLQTWTCLVVYKGHIFPVWDVRFSSHGYYFVSGGHDRTARLWATDHHQPIRIFAGHFSDVDVVEFHPNSNYIASGSSDRSVRLWDCLNGNCVRIFTGHKGMVSALAFSPCGRFLASASADYRLLIWDLGSGVAVAEMASHTATVHTLSFSRDCNILASGGLDNCLKLWDFARVMEENHDEDTTASHTTDIRRTGDSLLLSNFPTKSTHVLTTHFTRRNVLLAAGPFDG